MDIPNFLMTSNYRFYDSLIDLNVSFLCYDVYIVFRSLFVGLVFD